MKNTTILYSLLEPLLNESFITLPLLLLSPFSLFLGMAGYRYFEGMCWTNAYENAAMILSGMGPVDVIETKAGKIFAGSYALFSGIIFLVVMAIVIVPLFHRFLHKFLIEKSK